MKIHRGLEAGDGEFVATECAKEGMLLQPGDESLSASDDSGLRSAEELVSAEADKIRAVAQHLSGRGLVRQSWYAFDQAAAKVDNQRDALLTRDPGELSD